MYSLIEYSGNYSKTSGTLWKYCKDKSALTNDGTIDDFTEANAITNSSKIKKWSKRQQWHTKK